MKRDVEIMQHADGELAADARRELDELIAHDPEARSRREALDELGELVRGHLELTSDAVAAAKFDAMWRSIDTAVDAHAPPAVTAQSSWLRRISRWLDLRRGYIITAAASAGAVAALALMLRAPVGDSGAGAAAGAAGVTAATGVTFQPTEIEALDTPGGTGTVFNLHDEDGSTTVIWVTRDDSVAP